MRGLIFNPTHTEREFTEGVRRAGRGGPMVPGGEYERDEARARRLGFLVQGGVRSLPQAALRFVLMHPGVSTALVGFSDADQIREAVSATEHDPLPESHMERLRGLWGQSTA